MDPMTVLGLVGALAGSGGTEVNTSQTSNLTSQVSLSISNAVGGGVGTTTGGGQSAPVSQTAQATSTPDDSAGGYGILPSSYPLIGSAPITDPVTSLNSLEGTGGASSGWKTLGWIVGIAAAAFAGVTMWKGGR